MWLSKLERDLLAYYYKKDCSTHPGAFLISVSINVDLDEVIKEFGYLQGTGAWLKIDKANADLQERKLATVFHEFGKGNFKIRNVQLSIEGKDLGRKYSNKLDTIGLWCAAKEHQWLWVIIIFVAGGLVKWLFDLFVTIIKNNK